MDHATSAPTATPENHLSTQPDLSPNTTFRSDRCRKVLQISENLTLVDVALERVRHHWRTKKAKKAGKEGIPNNVAQLITQALAISRAHLQDYRDLIAQEEDGKQESIQAAAMTTEGLMDGLHPFYTLDGEQLKEPHEPIEKIKTVLSLLMASQDDETAELLITASQAGWALLLLSDLVEEAEKRAIGFQDHSRALYLEMQNRLKAFSLVPRESQQEGR